MVADYAKTKLPTVRDEKGQAVAFDDLKDGYLVKISLNNASLSENEIFGIYKGIKDSEFILEIEGDRLLANTAGRLCQSKLQGYYLNWVSSVEILARDSHTVFNLFHALGVSKVYYKNSEHRIKMAQSCLGDLSKLNFLGW